MRGVPRAFTGPLIGVGGGCVCTVLEDFESLWGAMLVRIRLCSPVGSRVSVKWGVYDDRFRRSPRWRCLGHGEVLPVADHTTPLLPGCLPHRRRTRPSPFTAIGMASFFGGPCVHTCVYRFTGMYGCVSFISECKCRIVRRERVLWCRLQGPPPRITVCRHRTSRVGTSPGAATAHTRAGRQPAAGAGGHRPECPPVLCFPPGVL